MNAARHRAHKHSTWHEAEMAGAGMKTEDLAGGAQPCPTDGQASLSSLLVAGRMVRRLLLVEIIPSHAKILAWTKHPNAHRARSRPKLLLAAASQVSLSRYAYGHESSVGRKEGWPT